MLIATLIVAKVLRLLLWATTADAASQCYSTGKNPATTLTCNTTCFVAVYDAEDDHLYRGCGTLEHDPEKATIGMLHVYFCNEDLCNAGNPFGKATSNSTDPMVETIKVAPLTDENELLDAVENLTTTIAAIENSTEAGTTTIITTEGSTSGLMENMTEAGITTSSTTEGSSSGPTTEMFVSTTIIAPSGATTTPGSSGSPDEWSTTTSPAGTTVPAADAVSSTQAVSTEAAEATTARPGTTTTHGQDSVTIGASAEPTTVTTEHSMTTHDASASTILPTTHSSSLDSSSTVTDLTTAIGVTEPSSATTPGTTTLHRATLPGAEFTPTTSVTDAIATKPKGSIRASRDNATVMNAKNTATAGTTTQPAAETNTTKQSVAPDEWTTANASSPTKAAATGGNASTVEMQHDNATLTKVAPSKASSSNTNGSMAGKEMHTLAASNIVASATVNTAGVSTPERQITESVDEFTVGNGASAVEKIGILINFALLAVFLR